MTRSKKLAVRPIERLIENMDFLEEMILCHSRDLDERQDYKPESTPPTNINLLNFKINMEKEIRHTCRKIERKIGFELPDGLK